MTDNLKQDIRQVIDDLESIEEAIESTGVNVPNNTPTSEYGEYVKQVYTQGQSDIKDNILINTEQVSDNAITTVKIADKAVTLDKLSDEVAENIKLIQDGEILDKIISDANTYTDEAVANMYNTSPEMLEVVNELATTLGDDTNVTTQILSDLANIRTNADSHVIETELFDTETITIPAVEASANLLNPDNAVVGSAQINSTGTGWFKTATETKSYVIIPVTAGHKYKWILVKGGTLNPTDIKVYWASGDAPDVNSLTPISTTSIDVSDYLDETIYAEAPENATYIVYNNNYNANMIYDYTEHGLVEEWVEYREAIPESTKDINTIKTELLPDLGIEKLSETVEQHEETVKNVDELGLKPAITTYMTIDDVDTVSSCTVVDNTLVTNVGSTMLRIEVNNTTPVYNKELPKGKYYLHFDLERANDDAIPYISKVCMPNNISTNYTDVTVNSKWSSQTLPNPENCSQLYHYVFEIDTENIGDISTFGFLINYNQTKYDETTGTYKVVSNSVSQMPSFTIKNFGLSDNIGGIDSDKVLGENLVVLPENIKGEIPLEKIDMDFYKLNPLDRPNYLGSLAGIFKSWGCIGDSLTEGGVDYNHENDATLTGYHGTVIDGVSYPAYFARALNVEAINYGKGGDCVKPGLSNSWMAWSEGNTDVWTSPKDAYIIALGTNDRPWDGNIETDIDLSDYNNNAATSVGGYAQIIQRLLEMQPKAKIFCVTLPHTRDYLLDSLVGDINGDIRAIADMFGCYVIDLERYGIQPDDVAEWKKIHYAGSHLNALGYKWLADTYIAYIDWIIHNNIEDFRNIQFIGTDYEYRY